MLEAGAANSDELLPELLARRVFGPEWCGPRHHVRLSKAFISLSASLMAAATLDLTACIDSPPLELPAAVSSLPEVSPSPTQTASIQIAAGTAASLTPPIQDLTNLLAEAGRTSVIDMYLGLAGINQNKLLHISDMPPASIPELAP